MTSEEIDLLIAEGDPLMPKDWNEEKERQAQEHLELVRLQCVEEYSSSPLYQARAEKNPDYWKNLSTGLVHLY